MLRRLCAYPMLIISSLSGPFIPIIFSIFSCPTFLHHLYIISTKQCEREDTQSSQDIGEGWGLGKFTVVVSVQDTECVANSMKFFFLLVKVKRRYVTGIDERVLSLRRRVSLSLVQLSSFQNGVYTNCCWFMVILTTGLGQAI